MKQIELRSRDLLAAYAVGNAAPPGTILNSDMHMYICIVVLGSQSKKLAIYSGSSVIMGVLNAVAVSMEGILSGDYLLIPTLIIGDSRAWLENNKDKTITISEKSDGQWNLSIKGEGVVFEYPIKQDVVKGEYPLRQIAGFLCGMTQISSLIDRDIFGVAIDHALLKSATDALDILIPSDFSNKSVENGIAIIPLSAQAYNARRPAGYVVLHQYVCSMAVFIGAMVPPKLFMKAIEARELRGFREMGELIEALRAWHGINK